MRLALEPYDYMDGIYEDSDGDWILNHVEDHLKGLIEKLVENCPKEVMVGHLEEIVFALGLPSEMLSPLLNFQETKDEAAN